MDQNLKLLFEPRRGPHALKRDSAQPNGTTPRPSPEGSPPVRWSDSRLRLTGLSIASFSIRVSHGKIFTSVCFRPAFSAQSDEEKDKRSWLHTRGWLRGGSLAQLSQTYGLTGQTLLHAGCSRSAVYRAGEELVQTPPPASCCCCVLCFQCSSHAAARVAAVDDWRYAG